MADEAKKEATAEDTVTPAVKYPDVTPVRLQTCYNALLDVTSELQATGFDDTDLGEQVAEAIDIVKGAIKTYKDTFTDIEK